MSLHELAAGYVEHGFAIVPIPRGRKGPIEKGWNRRENVITTLEGVSRLNGGNIGLAHAYSRTVALDVDDYIQARESLQDHGIDLDALLATEGAVQISSGRPNRCKLIFRLPENVDPLLTIQPGGYELRCMAENGLTVQDVLPPSIHPDTGKPYEWRGDWRRIPELPADLLALWRKLTAGARSKGSSLGIDHDPILQALDGRGMVRADKAGGKWDVVCPWSAEHTTGDDTAAYFEPHTGGYAGGAFRCLHAHCQGRTLIDVRAFLGLQGARDGFTNSDGPAPNGFDRMTEDDMPGNGKTEPPPRRAPLPWDDLQEREPAPMEWIMRHWIPHGHTTLLAGRAGIAKTLLAQHIGSAVSLGHEYIEPLEPRRVLMWAGEDDEAELWRRQIQICNWLKQPLSALTERFFLYSYAGMDITLAASLHGGLIFTSMLEELRQQVGDHKAEVVILDNIARLYGASENDRHAVTTFCAAVQGACAPAAVVLIGHPAKAAGSEYSGSTAWEGAVRARLYLTDRPADQDQGDDDGPIDDSVRYLARRKANYSGLDIRRLMLTDGVLVPDTAQGPRHSQPSGEFLEDIVRRAVRKLAERDIHGVASTASPNYLPRLAKQYGLLDTANPKTFAGAMRQMILSGALVSQEVGKHANRTPRTGLVLP